MSWLKWFLGITAAGFLLVSAAGLLVLRSLLQPVTTDSVTSQNFVIPQGQSVTRIAERLEEAGLIKNSMVFRGIVKWEGLQSRLQAGTFELSPTLTPSEIAHKLTQGTQDVWITIPEGWRTEEIAESLEQYDLVLYDQKEFIAAASGLEGQLFPDTYLIPKESTASQIVALLNGTFEKKVSEGLATEIQESGRRYQELLVLASLIEREAREYEHMRHVAGILLNRIEIGMPLQVDATLQYAKGYSAAQNRWWATPTSADKQLDSPFNTYANQGLPPTPICNPGLQAFKAALDPLTTDDLYYLHAPSGEMYYSETYDEHIANIQRYLR